jgi:hypothetical protein
MARWSFAAPPRPIPRWAGGSPRISRRGSSPRGHGPERLALPHAADRLLDALHALPAEPDGARRLGRSWKSLAAELGLSHEATYRALARLERTGALRREGRDRLRLPPFPRG